MTQSFHSGGRTMRRTGFRRPAPAKRGPVKQNIDINKFIKPAKVAGPETYVPEHTFEDFAAHPLLKRNIATKGFKEPSKIQDKAIPHGLEGSDVVGIANTGTGKTIAFGLPLLHKIMSDTNSRGIIIAPTRELAIQIEEELAMVAKGSGLRAALIIGGSSMPKQIAELKARPHVVVGTPGRLKDHVERGNLSLGAFDVVVLDEMDRMLDMGFIRDITFLLSQLSEKRQSLFFSATMDREVETIVQRFVKDPVVVSARTGETSDYVDQNIVRHTDKSDKMQKLHDVLMGEQVLKTIVFDETKRSTDRLAKELAARGFKAESLHGGKSQSQRERALKRFRSNEVNVLVATDVAARGIDIVDITHVINYSTPNTYDDYVHRIGRAGRAGRTGHALTFIGS